ncbi:P-type ATPase [Kitasatospora sp. NPDC001159]
MVALQYLIRASFQEVHAEHAVEALAAYIPQRAKALRDGVPQEIDATELVPGDIVVIEAGDRIAADTRLLQGAIETTTSPRSPPRYATAAGSTTTSASSSSTSSPTRHPR